MSVDLIPLDDSQEHELGCDCPCNPVTQWEDEGKILSEPLIIHNAFDKREVVERRIGRGIQGKNWGLFQ